MRNLLLLALAGLITTGMVAVPAPDAAASEDAFDFLFSRFEHGGPEEPNPGIFRIDTDGDGLRRTATALNDDGSPEDVWIADLSPDGTQALLVTDGGGIYHADLSSSETELLVAESKDSSTTAHGLQYSPDGTQVVYYTGIDPGVSGGIYLARSDLTEARFVVPGGVNPVWSPDGSQVAYQVAYETDARIYVAPSDFSESRQLVSAATRPGWSPDGTRLAFVSHEQGFDPYDVNSRLEVMGVDGSDRRVLAEDGYQFEAHIGSHQWSPDGTRIAYNEVADDLSFRGIVVNADGSGRTVLEATADGSPIEGPIWSPDGTFLLFAQYTEGVGRAAHLNIHRIRPDGTDTRLVVGGPTHDSGVHFLPEQGAGQASARGSERACQEGQVPAAGFGDTAGNAHDAAIDCVVWWGVAHGQSADTYAPAEPVTRAQMASFIAALIRESGGELPEQPSKDHFRDDTGSPHQGNVNRLADVGIVSGVGNRRYRPDTPVSREQMAAYLVRAYEYRTGQLLPASADYFADDAGSTHEHAINRSAESGLTAGTDGAYRPGVAVGRDQMASFLTRLLDLLVSEGFTTTPE